MQETTSSRDGDYAVRRCTPEDIPSVINVNAVTLPEHYSDYFYYEILKDFPSTFLIAENGGRVAGYIMCRMEYGLSMTRRFGLAKKGHIISVAVLREYRGRGVGTKLIREALEEVRKENGKECYLEVRITNEGAIELYKRLGFKVTSTLHGYYKDGESAYTMALSL
ncbi:MAG: GNAT family N-acetyltransferase [Nitrososphaerota archaeon]|jgi:ribosomal-protein-alanine N-acetyltransferase|nr:GNAT family N-acetyltransferase [Nitrososphaerota archaeon]